MERWSREREMASMNNEDGEKLRKDMKEETLKLLVQRDRERRNDHPRPGGVKRIGRNHSGDHSPPLFQDHQAVEIGLCAARICSRSQHFLSPSLPLLPLALSSSVFFSLCPHFSFVSLFPFFSPVFLFSLHFFPFFFCHFLATLYIAVPYCTLLHFFILFSLFNL